MDRHDPYPSDSDASTRLEPQTQVLSDDDFVPQALTGESEIRGQQLIILPEGATRAQAVQLLSRDIPKNQYGMPQFFLRSDLLPLNTAVSQDDMDAASVGLFYQEGFPTLEDGSTFWGQLPHEPMAAFLLFIKYLDQAEEQGIRQLDLLAAVEGLPLENLRQHYAEFYWSIRARAHDLFRVAAEEKKRLFRTRKMENTHYDTAGKLLATLQEKFADEGWLEELNAKEAIEALIELAKLQRLSVGLTGQNASSLPKNPLPEGASPQQIMEHLTKGSHVSEGSTADFMGRLNALFDDPEQGMVLQEAILRVGRPDQSTQSSGAGMGDGF